MTDPVPFVADDESIQRQAFRNYERTENARMAIIEQHASQFKWLTASLLTLNAGGLIAIGNGLGTILAGSSFLFGVLAALLVGVFAQQSAKAWSAHLGQASEFWIETGESLSFDDARHAELVSYRGSKFDKYAPRSGWLSALAFFIGCLILGVNLA